MSHYFKWMDHSREKGQGLVATKAKTTLNYNSLIILHKGSLKVFLT